MVAGIMQRIVLTLLRELPQDAEKSTAQEADADFREIWSAWQDESAVVGTCTAVSIAQRI